MARSYLYLRPWKEGDDDAFTPRADFAEERVAMGRVVIGDDVRWTLCRLNGEVVGVARAVENSDPDNPRSWGLSVAFAVLTPREIVEALKLARGVMRQIRIRSLAARFYAHARADNPAAIRTLGHLGFDKVRKIRVEGLPHDYWEMVR